MTSDQSDSLIAMIDSAWPSPRMRDDTRGTYRVALSPLDFGEAAEGVTRLIDTADRLPSIAAVKAATFEVHRERTARANFAELPEPDESEDLKRKARMHIANTRRFLAGEIDAATMMRESARIYAEERPFPADGPQVQRDTEDEIAKLRGKAGPLMPALRKALRQPTAPRPDAGGDDW